MQERGEREMGEGADEERMRVREREQEVFTSVNVFTCIMPLSLKCKPRLHYCRCWNVIMWPGWDLDCIRAGSAPTEGSHFLAFLLEELHMHNQPHIGLFFICFCSGIHLPLRTVYSSQGMKRERESYQDLLPFVSLYLNAELTNTLFLLTHSMSFNF